MDRVVLTSLFVLIFTNSFAQPVQPSPTPVYTKVEKMITMRDGTSLYTAIYSPENPKTTNNPILMQRTPYSCAPYGEKAIGRLPSRYATRDYILVYQDVRGRYKSEGDFVELRPQLQVKTGPWDIDESTDTYDTVDWLVKNVTGNNGKVGIYGISYPGGYAALGALSGHPALVASSPQAPTTDWFIGDDIHHNGAFFLQDTFSFLLRFTPRGPDPTKSGPVFQANMGSDSYKYFLELGPIKNAEETVFKYQNRYWSDIMNHPDYDTYWQSRAVQHQLKNLKTAVLNVGGLFDAENCFGPLACYKENEKNSPKAYNAIIMGPWSHGMWAGADGSKMGDQDWGSNTSKFFQEQIEVPFFEAMLRGNGKPKIAEATFFDTGSKQWKTFKRWPTKTRPETLQLSRDGTINVGIPGAKGLINWVSDPANPTPYQLPGTGRRQSTYMLADQRFIVPRPDVITFRSEPLTQDLTLAGPIVPMLKMVTDGTDMDVIVKVIDQYPDNSPKPFNNGYMMLVRGEVLRAKYRNSFSNPRPFVPGAPELVSFTMPDLLHTFKKGHRISVQIQSSWFPLVDRNPNQFVNIYKANAEDFKPATIGLFTGESYLKVGVLEK